MSRARGMEAGTLLAASLLLAAGAFPAPRAARAAARSGDDLRVLLVPRPGRPAVAFRCRFRTGSVDDPAGKEGLTSLTADLMAEGGTVRLASAALNRALFPMAASIRVQTDKECTTFYARVHRDHLESFLPILAEVLTQPRWDPAEFQRLRTDAIDDIERHLRSSDDENLGKQALQALLYEGHPYGHLSGGTVQGLRAITVGDVRAHAARVFGRARLTVALAGDVDEKLAGRVRQALRDLPAGEPAGVQLPEPSFGGTRFLLVEKDAASTAISMGFPWEVMRTHPDFVPLLVAISAFGEHRQQGGRLFANLRERRGLNYGDYAYAEYFEEEGGGSRYPRLNLARRQQYFQVWIRPVENRNRTFALRAALREVRRFAQEGITKAEFERARDFLLGYTVLWQQTDDRLAAYTLDEEFYGNPGFLEKFREQARTLTLEEVNGAVRRHIDPSRLQVAVVTQGAAAMRDEILAGNPTHIEYASPKDPSVLQEDKEIAVEPWDVSDSGIRVVPVGSLFEK